MNRNLKNSTRSTQPLASKSIPLDILTISCLGVSWLQKLNISPNNYFLTDLSSLKLLIQNAYPIVLLYFSLIAFGIGSSNRSNIFTRIYFPRAASIFSCYVSTSAFIFLLLTNDFSLSVQLAFLSKDSNFLTIQL